jgi:type II secretory ATPase GspE/PulE/Tfp pilus assembly ATPase PilB-like protein
MLLRTTTLAVCWAILALAAPALAQVGLGDTTAAMAIGEEMEAGAAGAAAAQAPEQPVDPAAAVLDPNAAAVDPNAAPPAPVVNLDQWNDEHSIARFTAPSVSVLKMLLTLMVFFAWVRTADWVNRDAQVFDLGYVAWNPVVVLPFVVAFLAALVIPNFWIGWVLMLIAWIVPLVIYAQKHNRSVEPHQMVFTSDWVRYQIAEAGKLVGLNLGSEQQAGYMKGPPVDLVAKGGPDDRTNNANLLTARQSPGYVHVKELVADMVDKRTNRVMLDYTQEAVAMRRLIDGVWHAGEPRDRESGDIMLAVAKQLANLNAKERRAKQSGVFGAKFENKKYECDIVTQGTKSGERAIVTLRGGAQKDLVTLEQIGMREKLRDQWEQIMLSEAGVIIISAPPEGGLTTLTDVSLLETDRLVRDFVAIEDVHNPQRSIENVEPSFYDPKQGGSPSDLIQSLARKYPNVYVCRDMVDDETARQLLAETRENRVVITNTVAGDATEAVFKLLPLGGKPKEFARAVVASLNTRLIRTLCEGCKVPYDPTPDLLKKLGIPAGKVAKLYRPPKPEEIEKPCKKCGGLHYVGRTGLFELMEVDDATREALLKDPTPDAVRKAARTAGMRTLQEEGILLVARGVTSIQELSRVLKGE